METPHDSNDSWQNFVGGAHQDQSSSLSSPNTSNGLMNPPLRRQPSTLSNSSNIRRELSSNSRQTSSLGLATGDSLLSPSTQRHQQSELGGSGGCMSNAVFPGSQQREEEKPRSLASNAIFSTSQQNLRQATGDASDGRVMNSSSFPTDPQPEHSKSLLSRFLSQGRGSSTQIVASSTSMESTSPLAAVLSRQAHSTSSLNQQQRPGNSRPNSNYPISQMISASKEKSSTSLSSMGTPQSNKSMGSFSSTAGTLSLSNSNGASSILNARLSASMDTARSGSFRNSMSMSAIGLLNKGRNFDNSSSIGNRLFPNGLGSSSSLQQNLSSNQSSSNARNSSFASALTARLSQSTINLGSSNKPAMSAVQSNMAMLLGRNQEQQHGKQSIDPQQQQQQDGLLGRKRSLAESNLLARAASSKVPRSLTSATARRNSATMNSDSLLHNSCKLYPKTLVVLESALAFDPEAIRRSVPLLVGNQEDQNKASEIETSVDKVGQPLQFPSAVPVEKTHKSSVSFKLSQWYSYPFNIAMKHEAGLDVLNFLAKAGPDALAKTDGEEEAGALGIALGMERPSLDVVRLILAHNHATKKVADRQSNLPLHIAVRAPLENPAERIELVTLIYSAYPDAIKEKNFCGETPLHVAVKSPFSCDRVVDFLQLKSNPDEESQLLEAPIPF